MSDQQLKCGVAQVQINPVTTCSLAGYFEARPWESILDDLQARALVFAQGDQYFAIVQFDLVTIPWTFYDAFLAKLGNRTPLNQSNLVITATHTHTAPEIRASKPGYDGDYVQTTIAQAVAALLKALDHMEEVTLAGARTEDRRFAFNRRYWMKDGRVLTNPPKLDPNIDRPEGGIDPEIPVLAVKDGQGRIKALLANIVNHADTIGGKSVSADWPGFFRRTTQAATGADSIVFPLIGCAGNINHIDVRNPDAQASYAEAERIGNGYAATVLATLKNLKPLPVTVFKTASQTITLPPKQIPAHEVREAQHALEKLATQGNADEHRALHSVDLAKNNPTVLRYFAEHLLKVAADKTVKQFTLNALAAGNIRIVALPAEPFVEIGLKIKNEIFPDNLVFVLSHANGTGSASVAGSYIPNSWNYGRGGYETTARSNPLPENTADVLIETVKKIKIQLNAG